MNLLSTLLKFGTTEITLVSVFGAILLGFCIYLCFVPMKNWFTALFSSAYIPTFKLISIKNRKLNVNAVVEAYVMAKKSKLNIKLCQIESLMLSGGDVKGVISALNLAKSSGIKLDYDLATAIELSSHDVMQIVAESLVSKVVKVENIKAFTQDKVEVIAGVNISVKLDLSKYIGGLGIDDLKGSVTAVFVENISKAEDHNVILREPNKTLLSGIDFRAITKNSMYKIADINVYSVETGRDINKELEIQAAEKEKIYAEIEAERMKHAEEIRELKMRTKTEEMKSSVLEAESEIPRAISQAIKEGRFSVMDYYKLMNLQADTALRRAFITDNKNNDDFGDEGEF